MFTFLPRNLTLALKIFHTETQCFVLLEAGKIDVHITHNCIKVKYDSPINNKCMYIKLPYLIYII